MKVIQNCKLTLNNVKKKIIHISKIDLQSQENYDEKKRFQEKSTYFRRQCKWCASR